MNISNNSGVRYAWLCWALLFITTAGIILSGSARTVFPAYREGALSWIAGDIIYKHIGVGGFTYLPQAAILFVPFSVIPRIAGEVLWRFVNIGVFAWGVYRSAGLLRTQRDREYFPLVTLIALPMAWDCARNGQATLAMTGLMLLAVVDAAHRKWWRTVLWLSLGISIKPLMIVLALLLIAIDRPLTWRGVVGMVVTAFIPFLTQHPGYVLDQYIACWRNFTTAAHVGASDAGWTSPFHALRLININTPEAIQTALRILAALGTLWLSLLSRRRHDSIRSAVFVFSLSVAYLMLFSPRTENNTYAMLGPALGSFFAAAYIDKHFSSSMMLAAMSFGIVAGRGIERMLTPNVGTSWVSPLIAVCFTGYLMFLFFGDGREPQKAAAA